MQFHQLRQQAKLTGYGFIFHNLIEDVKIQKRVGMEGVLLKVFK